MRELTYFMQAVAICLGGGSFVIGIASLLRGRFGFAVINIVLLLVNVGLFFLQGEFRAHLVAP